MKLYEIKAEFPDGKLEDYSVKANNYFQALKKIASSFNLPSDWKATVKFQCYRVR